MRAFRHLLLVAVLGLSGLAQTLAPGVTGSLQPYAIRAAEAVDLNGSGFPDLVGVSTWPIVELQAYIDPASGPPGSFQPGTPLRQVLSLAASRITLAPWTDWNGDGLLDLLVFSTPAVPPGVTSSTTALLFLAVSVGSFASPVALFSTTGTVISNVVLSDFNQDGLQDVAFLTELSSNQPYLGNIEIWVNGTPNWQLGARESAAQFNLARPADFTGDGCPDLAFCDSVGNVRIIRGNNGGPFLASSLVFGAGSGQVTIVDSMRLDADRFSDLLIRIPAQPPGQYAWGFLRGDATAGLLQFSPSTAFFTFPSIYWISVADFDADGYEDVVAEFSGQIQGTGEIRFFRNRGNGTVDSGIVLPGSLGPDCLVHDFDVDGDPDLLAVSANLSFNYRENQAIYGYRCGGVVAFPQMRVGSAYGGNAAFSVSLENAPPLALAGLFVSTGSNFNAGCGVYVDIGPNSLLLPSGGVGITSTNSGGATQVNIPLPFVTAPVGPFYLQWAVVDFAGPLQVGGASYSTSAARSIMIF